jgi:hypothetical protein
MQLRNDLQLLNDSGVTNIPLTAWPVAFGDVHAALGETDVRSLSPQTRSAYDRVRDRLRWELEADSIGVRLGERFSMNLVASYVENPLDGEEFRPDGTYADAITLSGGLTSEAHKSGVNVSRDGVVHEIDLRALYDFADSSQNLMLKHGDIINSNSLT